MSTVPDMFNTILDLTLSLSFLNALSAILNLFVVWRLYKHA